MGESRFEKHGSRGQVCLQSPATYLKERKNFLCFKSLSKFDEQSNAVNLSFQNLSQLSLSG